MQPLEMEVRVFLVPGDEEASLLAYDKLVKFLETHEDLFLTVYRGLNMANGMWSLVLIGEKTAFTRYQDQIQSPLSQVQAQRITVPPERLAPLVERFLARQAEMFQTQQTFVVKHHPLSKKYYAKKKAVRRSKRGKKRS